jgi:hypothetical protein
MYSSPYLLKASSSAFLCVSITFKLFNGQLELFYKEDEQRLFPVFKSARYDDGGVSAPNANKYSSKDMRDAQLVEYF